MNKIYQIVTDKILAAMDQGIVPWQKSWSAPTGSPMFLNHNHVTKHVYTGINVLLTSIRGFSCPAWITFNQLNKLGARIHNGQRSTLIVFVSLWKPINKDEDEQERAIPVMRYYKVWNLEQTTLEWTPENQPQLPQSSAKEIVESYVDAPFIAHDHQDRACYVPLSDTVSMPMPSQFPNTTEYYHVLFHELAHSTGCKHRLDRKELREYQYSTRPQEELIAEMAATFLCAVARLEPAFDQSASYIDYWRKKISEDPKLIIDAAAGAQKATDWILNKERVLADPNAEERIERLEEANTR